MTEMESQLIMCKTKNIKTINIPSFLKGGF